MSEVPGPLFLSHSSSDATLLELFAEGLRSTLDGKVRLFNTSEVILEGGRDWRAQVLEGIHTSEAVLLLATPRAFHSLEVCFELGAAAAYSRAVIPCCVGLSPAHLPLGLDNVQAFDLTTTRGWAALLRELAIKSRYVGRVEDAQLTELAHVMAGRPDLLSVSARGRTLELRNLSDQRLRSLAAETSLTQEPEWLARINGRDLIPADQLVIVRSPGEGEIVLEVSWDADRGPGQATFPLPRT